MVGTMEMKFAGFEELNEREMLAVDGGGIVLGIASVIVGGLVCGASFYVGAAAGIAASVIASPLIGVGAGIAAGAALFGAGIALIEFGLSQIK